MKGTLCIVGTSICYGLVPSFSFLAFDMGVKTATLLFDKFLIAAIIMWAFIFLRRIRFRFSRAAALRMIVVCAAYIGLSTTLYIAFDYISGSLATIVSFTFPAIIIAIEMLTGREPVRMLRILAVIMSFGGLMLIVWSPDLHGSLIGIAFAFGTAICYVIYIFGLGSESVKKESSFAVSGYVMLSAAAFNGVRCAVSGEPLFVVRADQLLMMILLSVVCVFLAILLYALGVKLIGPGNAALLNTLEPVLACIFGHFLVGDEMTGRMVIGSALVVLAMLVVNLPAGSSAGKRPRPRDPST